MTKQAFIDGLLDRLEPIHIPDDQVKEVYLSVPYAVFSELTEDISKMVVNEGSYDYTRQMANKEVKTIAYRGWMLHIFANTKD